MGDLQRPLLSLVEGNARSLNPITQSPKYSCLQVIQRFLLFWKYLDLHFATCSHSFHRLISQVSAPRTHDLHELWPRLSKIIRLRHFRGFNGIQNTHLDKFWIISHRAYVLEICCWVHPLLFYLSTELVTRCIF